MQEDEKQRINRELIELLNELRVLLPGVQMLFAFMLILPFTGAFGQTSEIQRLVYFGAFLCATAATGLLIAPSAYHRLLFRQGDKERLLWVGNRLAIVGTAFLGLAMAGAIFVVTNVLFSVAWAAAVAAVSGGWLAWLWFGLALRRRFRETPRRSGFYRSPRLRPGREERAGQPTGVMARRRFPKKARFRPEGSDRT